MAPAASKRAGALAFWLAASSLAIALMAATPSPAPEPASIVNSGSTNAAGWKIEVWPDGKASLVLQTRGGTAIASPKPFTVEPAQAAQFFKDLAAAKAGGAKTQPCMKSASFGSTTRVTWNGWTSPDLSCPPGNDAAGALLRDIGPITTASGLDRSQLMRGFHGEPRMAPPEPPVAAPPSPKPS